MALWIDHPNVKLMIQETAEQTGKTFDEVAEAVDSVMQSANTGMRSGFLRVRIQKLGCFYHKNMMREEKRKLKEAKQIKAN